MRTTNDKLADTLIGNNRGSIVADKGVSSSHEFVCPLSEACGNVPANAQYISMLINGATIEVKSANDVLTWVCRKMWITRMARLLPILRSRKYSWFKTDCCGMVRPLRISFNCYVDLDRSGTIALSRAVQILEWSGPHKAITITYRLSSEQIRATQKGLPTDGPERELKDVPTDVLVRTVLLEMLKQGRDGGETWEDFMSAPRCRRELGLSNSLLHKMKPWEKPEKYAGEYSVFDEEADYLILSDLGRLDRDGFLGWVQNVGISLEEVCSLLHVKLPCVPAPTPPPPPPFSTAQRLAHPLPLSPLQTTVDLDAKADSAQAQNSRTLKPAVEDAVQTSRTNDVDTLWESGGGDDNGLRKFSFKWDHVSVITGSEPITLIFKSKEYTLDGMWSNLPKTICSILDDLWPGKIRKLVAEGKVSNMALSGEGMRRGEYNGNLDVWHERNCSAKDIVRQARALCQLFGVCLDDVSILYAKKENVVQETRTIASTLNPASSSTMPKEAAPAEKIGAYVKSQIYAALSEDRIPDDDFEKLLTVDGTMEVLGTTLSACPLFANSPMIGPDGRGNNSWGDPAVRRGRCVFVNSQWYERHWDKARRLLSRWEKKPLQQAVARANVPSHYSESQIAELLETEFANGIRPGSIIDRNKIRKLYRQHFGEDLPGDFAFDTVLPKVGVVHDGKVFPRPSLKDGGWRDLIERLVGNGSSVFQFSRVMELHAAELMKIGIVSAEMLREAMMREASDTYEISGEVFAPKSEVRLADRLDSVFMPRDGAVIDMTDISERFPYVDVAFIRNLYKGHPNLIRIDQDRYAILARIDFDDSEVSRGRSYCETAIASDGFFSLAQLRLDDSAAMNDQRLTDNALRRVFFQRFLSDDFDAHGQIVCAKGASIDGQIPLHAFLNDRSEVSLDQIESVAKEYNIAPWLALKTAHEEMVRIDRDRFIAKGLISFDVAAIDDSIADVCEGYPRPFGAFANLSDFPAVPGFSWNEYLLEAFLRRLSVRFRLVSPSVPARDVSGAVVPRSADLPCAEDAFAAIALRCGVAAETEEVGDFLVATQCVLRRSAKTVGAVVSRMKELEKR